MTLNRSHIPGEGHRRTDGRRGRPERPGDDGGSQRPGRGIYIHKSNVGGGEDLIKKSPPTFLRLTEVKFNKTYKKMKI